MARAELKKKKEGNLRKAVLKPNQITRAWHQCHSKMTCTTQTHFFLFLFLQLLFSRFQISSLAFYKKPLEFSFCLNFSKLLNHVQKEPHTLWLVSLFLQFPSSYITAHLSQPTEGEQNVILLLKCCLSEERDHSKNPDSALNGAQLCVLQVSL